MKTKNKEPSSIPVLKKSKKSKHDNLAVIAQVVQSKNLSTDLEKLKKKKAKGIEHPEQKQDNSQKKGKKRRRRDAEEQEEPMGDTAQINEAEGESEPPKKKHKNRTSFADPREDKQLNTQSRKALEYVFTQMNRPSRWKFNKARQNWLIRNVWSSDTVPDIYFPLVLKYLGNVQGGSREKLKETCQTYLTVKPISVEAPSYTALVEEDTKPAKPTPGPLIMSSSQPTPGAVVPTAAIPSAPTSISDTATVLVSIKRTRAQSLLDVLTEAVIEL